MGSEMCIRDSPHIVGVPHIAHHLEQALDILVNRDDTVFVTSSEMGDWFIEADASGGNAVAAFNDAPGI